MAQEMNALLLGSVEKLKKIVKGGFQDPWLLLIRLGVTLRRGGDAHHEMEACFKAVGRVLGAALRRDPAAGGTIPSTKGAL